MARLLCALLLVGCAAEPRPESDVTSDQVASYRALHRQLETVAARYDYAIAMSTPELCISVHRTYNRDIRAIIARTVPLDQELDGAIAAHGGTGYADLACMTARSTVELDYHGAVACQEAAFVDNLAEASRHLLALATLVEHTAARIDEISGGLATKSETWTWSLPSGCL